MWIRTYKDKGKGKGKDHDQEDWAHARRTRHLIFIRVLSFFATLDHIASNETPKTIVRHCGFEPIRTRAKARARTFQWVWILIISGVNTRQISGDPTWATMKRNRSLTQRRIWNAWGASKNQVTRLAGWWKVKYTFWCIYIYNHNNKVSCHVRPCCSKFKDQWADAGGGHGHEPEPEEQDLTHVHVGNGHGPCASILDLEAFKQTDKQTTTHTARQTD